MRLALALASAALAGGSPVQGSISGPITAAHGKTFTVSTTLSPTGASKVSVAATTAIVETVSGTRGDLKKGACVTATGTRRGAAVAATLIALRPSSGGSCTGGLGRRPGGAANGRSGPPRSRPPRSGGNGFARPANLGFAFGRVAAVEGSTLTVKGFRGSTNVTVSAKTRISKTATVGASALKAKLCAFVFGTSSDKGVTVQARNVTLSKPVGGRCTFRRRPTR